MAAPSAPDEYEVQEQAGGYRYPESSPVRFPAWVGLLIFSAIALIASLTLGHPMDGPLKWTIVLTTLSTVFAIVSVFGYLFSRGIFMGQLPETVLGGIVIVLWGLGLPTIMNPNNSIAVSYTEVDNANLYFSSWACFCCCLWIVGSQAQETFGFDITQVAPRKAKAYGLVASSLVVMGSSIRIFNSFKCYRTEMSGVDVCRQTKFAISAGVIGFCIAVTWTVAAHMGLTQLNYELYGSSVLLVLWVFGLAFITFGRGPGHAIGNLYFATWISLIISIFLFSESLRAVLGGQEADQQQSTTEEARESTVPAIDMEEMDEEQL